MKHLKLNFRLLKRDLIKIVFISLIVPVLNCIIYSKNGLITPNLKSDEVVLSLFGAVDRNYSNWIYWIIFCVGYVVILQLAWKKQVHTFEINQLLRHKNTSTFWNIKMITGFIVTLWYVLSALLVMWVYSVSIHTVNNFDPVWLLILIFLSINFYVHGLIWLILRNDTLVEVANVVILMLFYAGTKLAQPYTPLYYSMLSKHTDPYLLMAIELMIIAIFYIIIINRAKRMDYFSN
ncbi:hypothetical protein GKZ89_17465 [Bacillus mangrovi]|uniref:Uncharacterized protein n=1 Tax=Metabacillus mangrovi TaxID=1491830 RepID=A0A7X2S817_9BACI|nr:hypothetical protein [Metabacillus mangrovi]MTH55190.1 hypothetical protein [Metabacillus mangrovi]